MKFLRESDLTANEQVLLQYSVALSNRFATIEQFLAVDESELLRLGISNRSDRLCLIKQAQLLDDKVNPSLLTIEASQFRVGELAVNQTIDRYATLMQRKGNPYEDI